MDGLNIEYVNNETLFYNNILLLGYEKEHSESECQTVITANCFQKSNPKAFFYVIHFLLGKLTSGESEKKFLVCYPPINSQNNIEFKSIGMEVFAELEKDGKIPRNFIVGKSILDTYHGERLVLFLRFLSEFALRFIMSEYFPDDKNEIFNIGKMNREYKGIPMTITKLPYDINLLYEFTSTNNESFIHNSISREQLKMTTDAMSFHMKLKREKLAKLCSKIADRNEAYREKAADINKKYQDARRKNIDLKQNLENIKNKVPPNLKSKYRSLDRIPLMDKSNEIFKNLTKTYERVLKQDLINKMDEYYSEMDSAHIVTTIEKETLIGKPHSEEDSTISLSNVYGKVNDNLIAMADEIAKRDKYLHAKHELEEIVRMKNERITRLKGFREKVKDLIQSE